MKEKEYISLTINKDIALRLKEEFIPDYNLCDVLSLWLDKKIKNENRGSLLSALTSNEIKEIKFVTFDIPIPEELAHSIGKNHSKDDTLKILDMILKRLLNIKPDKPGVLTQSEIDEILGSIAGDTTVYGKYRVNIKYISNGTAANNRFAGYHIKIREKCYETLYYYT